MNKTVKLLLLRVLLAWGLSLPLSWAQNLPDLTVVRISAIPQGFECQIEAELVNLGPGGISQSEFNSGDVEFYCNGSYCGSYLLRYVDRQGTLRRPRGDIVVRVPGTGGTLSPGETARIKVVVDTPGNGKIHESNEQNNSLERNVTCNIPLPDIAVTKIYTVKQGDESCWVWTEIKNLGPGRVNPQEENYAGIKFYKNGSSAKFYTFPYVDPRHQLENPGGTIRFPLPLAIREMQPGEQATFRVHADFNNITIHEKTKSNNDVTKTVKCDPLPDLAVTRIFLQPVSRGCKVKAEIKNLGGAISTSKFRHIKITLLNGSAKRIFVLPNIDGQWVLKNGQSSLVFDFPIGELVRAGTVRKIGVYLDSLNVQRELREDNNSKEVWLFCPKRSILRIPKIK
ncbi:hypothetical protein TST_0737 [Thermosulfidibacter takaii ABI70S6]|uniref:CARDB domain-containing protein n=1 Tax=Thermosulfidibacter takaii (strain DSM 17441 / JCM 13301 / NBRC 103674 / ABI70S6) TaxID=1298851 RepID=A0A0S3QT76_THET7|nr:hypothetical protein [Thermosulfidibacter takaii]BAT71542.1 hypothetical protein TST_0737 [Thermosulfidibacter takaii ABI70S6]